MSPRDPTEPGFLTPDLNALRIDQLQKENHTLAHQNQELSAKLSQLGTTLTEQVVEMRNMKESRTSQGKRLGTLESDVSELRAMKKILVLVGTVGLVGLGAYLKALFGG